MPSQVETPCVCGRGYVHCPRCGRRNPYYKKYESANLSITNGREIKAYRCSCGTEFTNEDSCTLQPKRKAETVTQETMKLGSIEHARLLGDWVVEMQKKHGWDAIRVYIEAQKAEWHLEAFGDKLDEDVRRALIERGLMPDEPKITEPTPTEPQESAVTLDDIIDTIKNLQEDSK